MNKFQIVLGTALASMALLTGCGKGGGGGGGNLPVIASVNPPQALPGATVTLTINNYSPGEDTVLFGGVPVEVTDTGADPSSIAGKTPTSDTLISSPMYDIKRQYAMPMAIGSTKFSTTGTVTVPAGNAGDVSITIQRGDNDPSSVSFTILGGDTSGSSGASGPASAAPGTGDGATPSGTGSTGPLGDTGTEAFP